MRCLVLSAETADIVCAVQDGFFYLMEEMRCRMSADVRTRRYDRALQLFAQRLTERLVRNTDTYRPVFHNQVWRQMPRIGVNEGERLFIL